MSNEYAARTAAKLRRDYKPGTGDPLHTKEPTTVASFRTWRGSRENVAWDRCLTSSILAFDL